MFYLKEKRYPQEEEDSITNISEQKNDTSDKKG